MTQSYADAATLAQHHADAIGRQIRIFTTASPSVSWHPKVQQRLRVAKSLIARSVAASQFFSAGDASRADELSRMTKEERDELKTWSAQTAYALQFVAQDAGVIKLWERHRIAYAIDPDLWRELGDADESTFVPAGILGKLPHPDPFVALPEPLIVPMLDTLDERTGEPFVQRVEGFFVTGRFAVGDGGHGYLSTSTTRMPSSLSLLICSRILRPGGAHARNSEGNLDYAWTRIGVNEEMTVGQMVEVTRRTFTMAASNLDWEQEIVLALRRCVAILLYLCATNADLQLMPAPPARRRGKGGQRLAQKPPRVVTVGWHLGAKLRAYRAHQERRVASEGGGRRLRPHVRRAHFHTYRVGAGRADSEIRWVSAIPVNFEHDADETTVVGVPRRKEAK